jgi:hypothetical protein
MTQGQHPRSHNQHLWYFKAKAVQRRNHKLRATKEINDG